MADRQDPGELRGDRPLGSDEPDAIGLRQVAAQVAEALAGLRTDASLVIGLEGRWGSGKSSLLLEIEQALGRLRQARPHSIVHFRPWLVGNRDALLAALFDDLDTAITAIEAAKGDTTRVTLTRAKRAGKAARKFAAALGRASGAVQLAGEASAIGPVRWIGQGLKTAGEWIGREPEVKSLDVLKVRLIEALKALDHRIIVTIDDIDRLEPPEMLEVLRLVRSVGDLPNILYLLCYDSDILAHGIKHATSVADGQAYLEKIVQLTIPVPRPETFQLRYWFEETLATFAAPRDQDGADRLKSIIDFEGGRRLTTPRAVVRVLDALRFLWPTLDKAGVDLADLVWLQLIKDGNPRLYRWIEQYCATAAELSLGTARVDEEERTAMLDELLETTGKDWFASLHYRHYFAEQLPGLELNYAKDGALFSLFANIGEHKRNLAIAGRRIASPDHYRLYFAHTDPSHALKQADFDAFWAASREGKQSVARVLTEMHMPKPARNLGKVDILLERIRGSDPATLTSTQCAHILLGFANVLDDLYRIRPFERFWITSPWDRAERMVAPLLRRLDAPERAATIDAMFTQGRALAWLTTLFRRETFAHGRAGNRSKPESERYFTASELDRIGAALLARYGAMTLDAILATITPIDILFAWAQGGAVDRVKELIAEQSVEDEQFLRLLDALRSTITTSEGSYKSLPLENVTLFVDPEQVRTRLDQIAADPARSDLALHAKALLAAAKIAQDF